MLKNNSSNRRSQPMDLLLQCIMRAKSVARRLQLQNESNPSQNGQFGQVEEPEIPFKGRS